MKKAVMCTVAASDLQSAVRALRAARVGNSEISILAPRAEGLKNADLAPDALRGAETGAIAGGVLAELASVASLVIPGLGPLVVGGPLVMLFVGTVGGTLMGGLTAATGDLGRLVGIPPAVAHGYEQQLAAGRVLLFVHYHTPDHKTRAIEVFEEFGADDIESSEEMGWQKRAQVP